MTASETYAVLMQQAALYGRESRQRTAGLIEAEHVLAAMLQAFSANPTTAGAEGITRHIAGMQREANQLIVVYLKETNI